MSRRLWYTSTLTKLVFFFKSCAFLIIKVINNISNCGPTVILIPLRLWLYLRPRIQIALPPTLPGIFLPGQTRLIPDEPIVPPRRCDLVTPWADGIPAKPHLTLKKLCRYLVNVFYTNYQLFCHLNSVKAVPRFIHFRDDICFCTEYFGRVNIDSTRVRKDIWHMEFSATG